MKWIKVTDKLPDPGDIVDIYNPIDGRVPDVQYRDDKWVSQYMQWTGRVTHWLKIVAPDD